MCHTPVSLCQCGRRPRPCSVPLSAPLSTREAADWAQLTSLSSLSVISSSLSVSQHLSLTRQKISLECDTGPGLTRSRRLMLHWPGDGGTGPASSWTTGHGTYSVIEI